MSNGPRFTMLEDCRPLNPPPGTRRTISLAQSERFTMMPEAQSVKPPSSDLISGIPSALERKIEGEIDSFPNDITGATLTPMPENRPDNITICQEIGCVLGDYLSGELPRSLLQVIEAHLERCDHCMLLIESYRETIREIRKLPQGQRLPESLEKRLRKLLQQT